jgi:hypothetical protein
MTVDAGEDYIVDLIVRFGNQVRHKCPFCHTYLKFSDVIVCHCGVEFIEEPNGKFKVGILP